MCLAERRAAVHASGGLDLAFDGSVFLFIASGDGVQFFPVKHAAGGVTIGFLVALVVDKAAEFFDGLVAAITALYSTLQ